MTTDYISEQEYLDYESSGAQTGDGVIQAAIGAASRLVEAHTGRIFSTTTSTLHYSPCAESPWVIDVDDISTTGSLVVKTDTGMDGSYSTTLAITTNFVLEPVNQSFGGLTGWPYTRIRGRSMLTFPIRYYPWQPETVQVHAVFGWPAVPDPVKQATKILAAQYVKLGDSPLGVAGFGDFGAVRVREIPQVAALLAPYRTGDSYGIG